MAGDEEKLKRRFHEEMLRIYHEAKVRCRGYKGSRFIRMVEEKRGFQTAKSLLMDPSIQDGFTNLWMCGCSDLTAEYLVLEPEFETLFTEEERAEARRRLER